MIEFKVGQMKKGIIVFMEDKDEGWQYAVPMKWMEAAGLKHALDDALANPLWKDRDPKSKLKEVRFAEAAEMERYIRREEND